MRNLILYFFSFTFSFTLLAQPYPSAGTQCGGHGSGGCDHYTIVQVKEAELPATLKLFPNPTSGILQLEFTTTKSSKGTIQIIDAHGRRMLEQSITIATGINQYQLALGHLSPGVYQVQVQSGKGILRKKVLLMR